MRRLPTVIASHETGSDSYRLAQTRARAGHAAS
jgi:hypothetical protein